ncbi:MAG: hypothetical protein ABJF10_26530 [Chthoniobacter sp.]
MTKQEYISRRKAMGQSFIKWMIGWLVVFLCLTLGPQWRYFEQYKEWKCVFCAGMAVILGGMAMWLGWFVKRQQQRFGISCPSCGGTQIHFRVVTTTGRCEHCAATIFSETKAA